MLELSAKLILEPEGRDSAPAMAAAAYWTAARNPAALNIFVASDHHIPDHDAFMAAVRIAAERADRGAIVTLGVRPTSPSSAYGYIAPAGDGLSPVAAFVEKPDAATAERYVEERYLWNSGNFIARSQTLLEELTRYAPAVLDAVCAALPSQPDAMGVYALGPGFAAAPKISIDYAVMEKTEQAFVLPVDFEWSDLGAWDAVHATGEGSTGTHIFEDSEGCLVRACDGVLVAAIGLRNLAIVVERDAVLVTDLSRSQDIKTVVERLHHVSPKHLDFPVDTPRSLQEGAQDFAHWLRLRALPLWTSLGQFDDGAFAELLSLDGRAVEASRRARVQTRQVHVMNEAGLAGWMGPWSRAAQAGLSAIARDFIGTRGRMPTLLSATGKIIDPTAMLYDQAFLLLCLASTQRTDRVGDWRHQAQDLRDGLIRDAGDARGFIEAGSHPYQSNAHMHLLEASLAWEEAGGDQVWPSMSDRIVDLALSHFIDADTGCLREFFDAAWRPAPGEDGRRVEPGHQFEWAWLLAHYGASRGREDALAAARHLHAFGRKGIDVQHGVTVDALADDGSLLSRRARLWPQTEWMKSALILAEHAQGDERLQYLDEAAAAQRAVLRYLMADGLWHDKLLEDGRFLDEPAPASSLYHIMGAWRQVAATARRLDLPGADRLTLA